MRKLNIYLVLFSMTLLIPKGASAADQKMYDFPSAIYEMIIKGNMTEGRVEGYIEDHGRREAKWQSQTVRVFGMEQREEKLELRDGFTAYHVDLLTNQGSEMDIRDAAAIMGGQGSDLKNLREFSDEMIRKFGGEKVRTEVVLGKKCDVYFFPNWNMTIWLYKRFPLKTMINMMGMQVVTEAVRFEENVRIPKEKMQLPAGAQIEKSNIKEAFQQLDGEGQDFQQGLQQIRQVQNSPEYQQALQQMQTPQFQQQYQNQLGQAQQQWQQSQHKYQQNVQQVQNWQQQPIGNQPIGSSQPIGSVQQQPVVQNQAAAAGLGGLLQNVLGGGQQQQVQQPQYQQQQPAYQQPVQYAGNAVTNYAGNVGQTAVNTAKNRVNYETQRTVNNAVNSAIGALFGD